MALVSHVCGTTALVLQNPILQLGGLLWHMELLCIVAADGTSTPYQPQEDGQITDLIRGPLKPLNHSVITYVRIERVGNRAT